MRCKIRQKTYFPTDRSRCVGTVAFQVVTGDVGFSTEDAIETTSRAPFKFLVSQANARVQDKDSYTVTAVCEVVFPIQRQIFLIETV
jgi:hypothetical protein